MDAVSLAPNHPPNPGPENKFRIGDNLTYIDIEPGREGGGRLNTQLHEGINNTSMLILILISGLIQKLIMQRGVYTQLHEGTRKSSHDINTHSDINIDIDIDIDIDIRRSFCPVAGGEAGE